MKYLLKRIEENKGMIYGKDIITVMSIMDRPKNDLTEDEQKVRELIRAFQHHGSIEQ